MMTTATTATVQQGVEDLFAQLVDARRAANIIRRQDDAMRVVEMTSQERGAITEVIDSLEILIKHLDAAFPE